jgi:hypothetical protein
MKRRISFSFILAIIVGMALCAQEELAMWSQMFDAADTMEEQLQYVRNVSDGELAGAEDFYAKVLAQLIVEYPSFNMRSQWDAADSCARILAPALGNAGYKAAAGDLWQMVGYFSNPLVKSDALIALGKIGDKTYLPQVVQLLKDLNARPQSDREMRERNERIAYGAILSLENYKDPAGYEPVFFASIGWYAPRITTQASVSLPNITDDPTDFLVGVIRSSSLAGLPDTVHPYEVKNLAVRTSERSESPANRKALVALAALTEGWRASTNDVHLRSELAAMRKLALSMLRRYGGDGNGGLVEELKFREENFSTAQWPNVKPEERDTGEALCAGLRRSYDNGDTDEKLAAVQTLSALGSNDAARLLGYFLMNINQRRQSNSLTRTDEQLVRAVIPALGATRRGIGRPALRAVQQSSAWTNEVRNRAAAALKVIDENPR